MRARRTADLLRDDLLLAVLSQAIVIDTDVERLLTALRRVLLLEVGAERFLDGDLQNFAVALCEQAAGNEYVFAETPEECARLEAEPVDVALALAGDRKAGLHFLT